MRTKTRRRAENRARRVNVPHRRSARSMRRRVAGAPTHMPARPPQVRIEAVCQTRPEPTDGAYIRIKEVFCVAYLLLILVLAGLIYAGWRLTRMTAARPKT